MNTPLRHPAPLAALRWLAFALACLPLACGSGSGGRQAELRGPGALERSLGLEPRSPATPEELTARMAAELAAPREANAPSTPIAALDEPAEGSWPIAPHVRVRLLDRDDAEHLVESAPPLEWTEEDRWRWSEERIPLAGMALLVWREQWRIHDATRVTLALVNGIPGRGVAYFKELQVELEDKRVVDLAGQHCVLPRGILLRRSFHGPGSARLVTWSMVRGSLPGWTPAWVAQRCAEELSQLRRLREGEHTIGPYRIGDPLVRGSSSLSGSHGGWKIAPYGGGRESWFAGVVEGWQLANEQFQRTVGRSPIAILDAQTLEPFNPRTDYWLGRTVQHEPEGFRDEPDGWCPYAAQLAHFRPHDYSHLWRQIRDAAMLARFDAAARWFLLASWHDCTLWLDSGGAQSGNPLFWPLEKLVASTPPGKGAGWANRGFAHVVRCFLEAEPYLPEEDATHWRERLVAALRHVIVPGTGVAHANPRPDDLDPTLVPPTARAREVDLLGSCFLPLGMVAEDADWRRFMQPVGGNSVSGTFEIRPGMKSWSDGRHAIPRYFPEYDAFRGDLGSYGGSVEGLQQHARTRPVNDNPLDWTDPAAWR